MARITIRYLTIRPGAADGLPRYFWQPSSALRAEGWRPQRLPVNWTSYTDAHQLEVAAFARASELNAEMDAVRTAAARAITRPVGPPPPSRTLGDLIKLYQASGTFAGLAPSTQRGYRQCLDKLDEWAADAPVRAIDALRIQRFKSGLSATPAYANAVVRVLRLLLEFGRREGWLHLNPATRPDLAGSDPAGLIWPVDAVNAFVATADAMGFMSMGTAVMLNEWIGQRQGDILRMPRSIYRNGTLVLRQSKRGAGVVLPVNMVARLQQRLDAEMARHAARDRLPGAVPVATIIVHEETGRPYPADTFRHVFARVRAKMAETHPRFAIDHLLPGRDMADPRAFTIEARQLTFMRLRHTAITRLAEAECDASLIASISGHAQATVVHLLERYMVRTATMARIAFQRRLDAEAPRKPSETEGVA